MVADVWHLRPVLGIALHRNNCSFKDICPRDNERVRVESALLKLATLNDLLEMLHSENSVDDMRFIGVGIGNIPIFSLAQSRDVETR